MFTCVLQSSSSGPRDVCWLVISLAFVSLSHTYTYTHTFAAAIADTTHWQQLLFNTTQPCARLQARIPLPLFVRRTLPPVARLHHRQHPSGLVDKLSMMYDCKHGCCCRCWCDARCRLWLGFTIDSIPLGYYTAV